MNNSENEHLKDLACELYDKNIKFLISSLNNSPKSKYFVIHLTQEEGLIIEIKSLVKLSQYKSNINHILLIRKSYDEIKFGNRVNMTSTVQMMIVDQLEQDCNRLLTLNDLQYKVNTNIKDFDLKSKVNESVTQLVTKYDVILTESRAKKEKTKEKKLRKSRRKKQKEMRRLLKNIPDFEDFLRIEKERQFGTQRLLTSSFSLKSDLKEEEERTYFKYFYKLNNHRYQYIVVY